MKFVTLLTALTAAALAQEAPSEKPAAEKPNEAPAANKPELKPAQVEPRPATSDLKPTPPDLPVLPSKADETDLTKGQPGARLKPNPEKVPQVLPDTVPATRKPAPGSMAERGKTRTTLKPPVTAVDLDLRIRYRNAESKASAEPAIQTLWEESRVAKTDFDKRAALKAYYTKLYTRMLAIDKGIQPVLEDRRRYNLRRLDQTRIEPTDPLEDAARYRYDF